MVAATFALTSLVPPSPAQAAAIGPGDFLKASGSVLKKGSGTGAAINLRGTNVGGWLTQEDWMSPLGEFAVSRSGWSTTASTGKAASAVDGSSATRWTTGSAQVGGEWLQVDLGAPTLFNRLSFDNTNFAGDYAREFEVAVSTDGFAWVSVAKAGGSMAVTVAKFAPQVAKFVRVTQTGTSISPWSVAELNLFNDPVMFNGPHKATASSAAYGTTPGAALDGVAGTAWSSGLAQVPGQFLTVDLGKDVAVDKILFDSGAGAPNDYPRTWDVLGSTDGVNFTEFATGYGTNRVVAADFQGAKTARFIRIAQNGTSAQWWTVAEVAIYSGTSLDRGGWAVTTSGGTAAGTLVDGNIATRWTSNIAQAAGQWIQADFGALLTVNNVTLDTEKNTTSEEDYSRGYTLEVSRNGSTWTQVAAGVGTRKATTIAFIATSARYIRLNQTAVAPQWWSVGELTASLNNDDFSLQNTLASRFGVTGAQAVIDAHQSAWLTTADLDNIAGMGLNFVRLPIGWNTFLNLDGTWKANPWTKIDWIVNQLSARGVYTLLDLHTVPGGGCPWGSCGRVGPNPNGFWGSSTYQNQVEDIWKAIAARYKSNPAVAGYDLINEPLIDYGEDADDVAQKSAYYDRLYKAVRAIDADHTIYLGAFFGYNTLAAPSTYGWTNVVYEMHPYDMPNAKDWTAQNQLVTNELSALPAKLASPGVPILYGEYSLNYNDDVWARFMAGLNSFNVSWSNWSYKVKGSDADGFGYWGFYYNNAAPVPIINSDDSATFVQKVQRFGTTNFTQNPRLVATVSKYASGLSTFAPVEISKSGWMATASSTGPGGSPSGAIDAISTTRWNSGQAQAGGEWYQIDFGSARTLAMVTVQTPADSKWDYPRGYTLAVSANGTTWTTVGTGIAYGWKRPISITPQSARYIRITQTGTAPQWWSIDEVTAYSSY